MNIKALFIIAGIGILAGIISIIIYNERPQIQAPLSVSYNPYDKGVYANGIVESDQSNGSNINIFPEVSGTVTKVFVKDGQNIKKNDLLFSVDDSVQREIVEKDKAQVQFEQASLINVQQQLEKIAKSYALDPKSVSKNALDNAENAVKITTESLNMARAQYRADQALLDKYLIHAPADGIVLRTAAAKGDYVSPQGIYDTYTVGYLPAVQEAKVTPFLNVRCYLDEILIPKLPANDKLEATLFVRGLNSKGIPLQFVSIQPYAIPNIQLSDERNIRVDVRVLPIIFQFKKPSDISIYPGQLVDVYIKGRK